MDAMRDVALWAALGAEEGHDVGHDAGLAVAGDGLEHAPREQAPVQQVAGERDLLGANYLAAVPPHAKSTHGARCDPRGQATDLMLRAGPGRGVVPLEARWRGVAPW